MRHQHDLILSIALVLPTVALAQQPRCNMGYNMGSLSVWLKSSFQSTRVVGHSRISGMAELRYATVFSFNTLCRETPQSLYLELSVTAA